jgi:exopolysaccharide biosynthesis polyprenyl glycosylphosphotransferase
VFTDTRPIEPVGGGVLTFVFDAMVLSGVYLLTCEVASLTGLGERPTLILMPGIVAAWAMSGSWRRTHAYIVRIKKWAGGVRIFRCLLKALAVGTLMVLLVRLRPLPDLGFALLFLGTGTISLFGLRFVLLQATGFARQLARKRHRVLLIGNNQRTLHAYDALMADSVHNNLEVVGLLDDLEAENPARAIIPNGRLPHGDLDELELMLRSGGVDEVLVTLPVRSYYESIQQVVNACNEVGIRVQILSDIFDVQAPRREVTSLSGAPLIAYASGPAHTVRLALKRYLDVLGSMVGILVTGVPMLVIAAAVKLTSPGPVLFRQTRSGLNGRTFTCLKFRTMVQDAEARKAALLEQNEVSGPVFKMRRDPRITPVGRILRKYSLDELPQLFSVLIGDMSLVGPRPPTPDEVAKYNRWQLRRLSMRPGLTCIWQVSGRNNIAFEDWIRLDLKYIDNWSLLLDTILIVKTLPAMIRGTGM